MDVVSPTKVEERRGGERRSKLRGRGERQGERKKSEQEQQF